MPDLLQSRRGYDEVQSAHRGSELRPQRFRPLLHFFNVRGKNGLPVCAATRHNNNGYKCYGHQHYGDCDRNGHQHYGDFDRNHHDSSDAGPCADTA